MEDLIKSLADRFQELLRYAYSGFLFIALLRLAEIQYPSIDLIIFGSSHQIWNVIVISFLLSFLIYNLHRFFLHEYVLLALFAFGISEPGRRCKNDGKIRCSIKCLFLLAMILLLLFLFSYLFIGIDIPLFLWIIVIALNILSIMWLAIDTDYFTYYRKFIKTRTESKPEFNNYVTNRWATTHALGITWWLPALFYKYGLGFTCGNGFIFRYSTGFWIVIVIVFLTWIYQVITLSFVEHEFKGP